MFEKSHFANAEAVPDEQKLIEHLEDARAELMKELATITTFYDLLILIERHSLKHNEKYLVMSDSGEAIDVDTVIVPILEKSMLMTDLEPDHKTTGIRAVDEKLAEITEHEAQALGVYRNTTTGLSHPTLDETVPLHSLSPSDIWGDGALAEKNFILIPGSATGPVQLQQFSVELAMTQKNANIYAPEVFVPSNKGMMYAPGVEHDVRQTRLTSAYAAASQSTLEQIANDETNQIPKADLIGYSAGAVPAIAQALESPDTVRSVTLVNPAGMTNTGRWDVSRVVRDGIKNTLEMARGKDQSPMYTERFNEEAIARQSKRGALFGYRELFDIIKSSAKTHLPELIDVLQHEYNIRVAVVTSIDDAQFDYEATRQQAADAGVAFHGVTGRHGELGNNPSKMARAITDAHAIMEIEHEMIAQKEIEPERFNTAYENNN